MIYLASPYSHQDQAVQQLRFDRAARVTRRMMERGHRVFSPIVYGHTLASYGLEMDAERWIGFDLAILANCQELGLLLLDGWKQSKGMKREFEYAVETRITICLVHESGDVSIAHPWDYEREFDVG